MLEKPSTTTAYAIRKERNDSKASTEALRPRALHTGQWAPQGHSRDQKERAKRETGSTAPGLIAGDLDHPGTAAVTSRAGLLPLSYPSPLGPRPSGACRLADVGKQLVLPTETHEKPLSGKSRASNHQSLALTNCRSQRVQVLTVRLFVTCFKTLFSHRPTSLKYDPCRFLKFLPPALRGPGSRLS